MVNTACCAIYNLACVCRLLQFLLGCNASGMMCAATVEWTFRQDRCKAPGSHHFPNKKCDDRSISTWHVFHCSCEILHDSLHFQFWTVCGVTCFVWRLVFLKTLTSSDTARSVGFTGFTLCVYTQCCVWGG